MSWLLFVLCLAYIGMAIILPTLITAIRHGQMALSFHRGEPLQQAMGAAFAVLIVAIVAWTALIPVYGHSTLGVWTSSLGPFGAAVALAGFALTLAAQWNMGASWRIGIDDRPTELITSGLYRFIRNPIFSGMILTLAGLVLATPSAATIVIFALTTVIISFQVRLEERHLAAIHGQAWQSYSAHTGRFIPGLGRLASGTATPSHSQQLADKPMPATAFRTMAAIFKIRDLFVKPQRVIKNAQVQPGELVLDFGCGPGAYSLAAAKAAGPQGHVTAIDIVPVAVKTVQEKAKKERITNLTARCSSLETGLSSDSIDRVLVMDVVHMFSDRIGVLTELERVLKQSGILVTSADHMKEQDLIGSMNEVGLELQGKSGPLYLFSKA